MNDYQILLIDDDISFLHSMQELLTLYDYSVKTSQSGWKIKELLAAHEMDLILVDLKMPDINGLQVLKKVKSITEEIPVIMISGEGEIKHAVSALKIGAFDFIEKGVDVNVVLNTIKNALKKRQWILDQSQDGNQSKEIPEIIAESSRMKMLVEMARKLSSKKVPVLLTGDSGTGKELIARSIHFNNRGNANNFVAINCANLQENLLESELFGYKKGAFTGAVHDHRGKILEAANGTLFLDEIGELPLSLQAKLLRVLQENDFTPIGDTRPVHVDFRLISATNRDLTGMIRTGSFREDLYYRINPVTLFIPPLKERKEDILPLINYYLNMLSSKHQTAPIMISDDAMDIFLKYDWPGNVRELKNFIENLVVFCNSEHLDKEHLYEILSGPLHHHPLNNYFN